MAQFKLVSNFKPSGDQPSGIRKLTEGLGKGVKDQTLLGVTGSGKTFTMANLIANFGRATLIISHNKTLAAQLYAEFKGFFPENAVEYFVSYYDYYQPEAYIPQTDTYIEKDASINDELDRLRLSATSSLLEREDVIIVASVSSIFGLGSPEEHKELFLLLEEGEEILRDDILRKLVHIQYERNDFEFMRGKFRVRGDCIDIFPAYSERALRIEQSGERIERIVEINPLTGEKTGRMERTAIYPAKHFVTSTDRITRAIQSIKEELRERLAEFKREGKLLEAQRLEARTNYDMEMMQEIGYCQGIENYSRHISGRLPGEPPYTLIDYFPESFLMIIDESHVTIPQIKGMYNGDRSRKETLVEHGFRLPSALDNRPLNFREFEERVSQVIYVSATPAPYEIEKSGGVNAEQVIRPTGLVDPQITVKPVKGQIDDLIAQIKKRVSKKQRVLVTTLTKRMAEDLADYLQEVGLRVRYLHSEIDTLERTEIIRDLRLAKFDCLVGINLLREGLDLPEVSLVTILDADKEGFLRSQTSLIQVAGRAARNVDGEVIMYADTVTNSMRSALAETGRRRKIQTEYNKKHRITPRSIQKSVNTLIELNRSAAEIVEKVVREPKAGYIPAESLEIGDLEKEMVAAAERLEFEEAAILRDRIAEMRKRSKKMPDARRKTGRRKSSGIK